LHFDGTHTFLPSCGKFLFDKVYNMPKNEGKFLLDIFSWEQLASFVYQCYTKAVGGKATGCGKSA